MVVDIHVLTSNSVGGDGGEEQVAEVIMVVGMVKVGKFGSHALSDGFHERFDVGRA